MYPMNPRLTPKSVGLVVITVPPFAGVNLKELTIFATRRSLVVISNPISWYSLSSTTVWRNIFCSLCSSAQSYTNWIRLVRYASGTSFRK